jgi:hypothetical protein
MLDEFLLALAGRTQTALEIVAHGHQVLVPFEMLLFR